MVNMTHRQYVTKFSELGWLLPTQVDTEKKWINRYLWGLPAGMRELVRATKPDTFQEALNSGYAIETDLIHQGKLPARGTKRKFEDSSKDSKVVENLSGKKFVRGSGKKFDNKKVATCKHCHRVHKGECRVAAINCFKCGKKGHYANKCLTSGTCFECGEEGHRRFECPKLQVKAEPLVTTGERKGEAPKGKGLHDDG